MTVAFDPETHTYTADGNPVPSVTQLVAPLGSDYDEPDDLLESVLDAATDRGVTMHGYLEHRLTGGSRAEYELPELYEPYADAADLFLSEHRIIPLSIETPMACADFAGTPDLVCEFDGFLSVLDYKFVSQVAKAKVAAQLAGYQTLCEENGIFPDRLYAVQFLSSGSYRLYPVGAENAKSYFRLCLELARIKTKKHPRGRID